MKSGYAFVGLIVHFSIAVLVLIGWIINAVAVFNMVNNPVTGEFILRVVGIFVGPLGAVLGWLM